MRLFREFGKFLTQSPGLARRTNDERRSRQTVNLIDDAIETYPGVLKWEERFKNPRNNYGDLFVLVCVHGSASGTVKWGTHRSQAAQVPMRRRIELQVQIRQEDHGCCSIKGNIRCRRNPLRLHFQRLLIATQLSSRHRSTDLYI